MTSHSIRCRVLRDAIAKLSNKLHTKGFVGVGASLVFSLLSLPAHAQGTGVLVGGRTCDFVSGKPVAEVQIVAHNLDKNIHKSTSSDANGMYKFTNLEPGRYDLAATKTGFHKVSETIDVDARQTARVDLLLEAGIDSPAIAEKADDQPMSDWERRMKDKIDRLEARLAAIDAEQTSHSLAASANPADVPAAAAAPTAGLPPSPAAAPSPEQANVPTIPEALQSLTVTQGVDNFTPFAFGDSSWKRHWPRPARIFDEILHPGNSIRYELHRGFRPTEGPYDWRLDRRVPIRRISDRTGQRGRRLSLGKRARQDLANVRRVCQHNLAE